MDSRGKGPALEVRPEVNSPRASTVVLYDGVCGLCNRLNRFLLRRDRHGRILFAALQGQVARETLARHKANPSDLDTVYVMADWQTPRERALSRSRGVLYAVGQLGGGWKILATLGTLVPPPLADLAYRLVARNRYRIFGKYDSCPIPPPEWRARFLDHSS